MDLKLGGRRALVCGSSAGLGRACAEALAAEGASVVLNGRDQGRLNAAVQEFEARFGSRPESVCADVASPEGVREVLEAAAEVDIVVLNSGGPAPADFLDITAAEWREALTRLMVSPIELVRGVLPGMRRRGYGRIVFITSAAVVELPPRMHLSSGPRTGLTAVMKSLSRDVIQDNVTINALVPRRFDTGRQIEMARRRADETGLSFEEVRASQIADVRAGRLGKPQELGALCAFLCGADAGYLTGAAIALDGGGR